MQGSRIHSLCYTRNLLGLRLYAAILSMVWSDYNGRYCMGMGMIMQAEVLKSDLIAIQRQRLVRKRYAGGRTLGDEEE